jgi:hypothetical protein
MSHLPRIGKALLTGTGVGIPGANHDGTDIVARQSFAANLHWCGADAVLSKDSRGTGRSIGNHDCEVAATGFGPQA